MSCEAFPIVPPHLLYAAVLLVVVGGTVAFVTVAGVVRGVLVLAQGLVLRVVEILE